MVGQTEPVARSRSARQGGGCVQSAVVCSWRLTGRLADVVLIGGRWKRKQNRAVAVEIREAARRGVVARELPAARPSSLHSQHTTQGAASPPSAPSSTRTHARPPSQPAFCSLGSYGAPLQHEGSTMWLTRLSTCAMQVSATFLSSPTREGNSKQPTLPLAQRALTLASSLRAFRPRAAYV